MEQQDWEGKQLDKDLLLCGNKVYSPSACCFVTSEINKFILQNPNTRGNYLLGVSRKKTTQSYSANIKMNGKLHYIGSFNTEIDAHRAWQQEKICRCLYYIDKYKNDELVVKGLYRVYTKLLDDYNNNEATIYF